MADQNTNQAAAPVENSPAPQATSGAEADEKLLAAIGYIAFLFVIPLLAKPKSAFCKFHAKQSMVLFLITIVVLVVLASIPMIGSLLTLALFAVYVLSIYRAYMGEMWNIPLVSNFAGKIDTDKLYGQAGLAVSGISGLGEKAGQMAQKAVNTAVDTAQNLGKQEDKAPAAPEKPAAPKK
jgi:uncharacterized membrane protein